MTELTAPATAKAGPDAINKVLFETGGNREKVGELLSTGRKSLYHKLRQNGNNSLV
ncbi:MAG: helix-turn-helix domain-containing protein [Planctomycetota bacterium]